MSRICRNSKRHYGQQPALVERLKVIQRRRDLGGHTLAAVWRRHRLSCPSREDLGSFLLDTLDPELRDYVYFHITEVGCRMCQANLRDLEERQQAAPSTARTAPPALFSDECRAVAGVPRINQLMDLCAANTTVESIMRWFFLICWSGLGVTRLWSAEPLGPGVVTARPADGRAVEVTGLFLVPYEEIVPGSAATFAMVPIPGGTFLLGSPTDEPDREDDEGPQLRVQVEPFWMGKYEVTWSEYKQFMALYDLFKDAERQKKRMVTKDNQLDAVTAPTPLYDPTFTFALGEEPRQPAVSMTEYAARQYTKFLSLGTGDFYRLPTEAEWEYACRGGTTTAYAFGDGRRRDRRLRLVLRQFRRNVPAGRRKATQCLGALRYARQRG